MRRAVLTLGGTVAGLAALFSYKTHAPGITPAAEPSAPAGLSVSAPASPSASAPASASPSKTATKKAAPTTAPTTAAPVIAPPTTAPTTVAPTTAPTTAPPTTAPTTRAPTTPAPAPSTSSPAAPSGSFSGSTVNTQYGPVQVTISVTDGKITSASDPDGGDSIAQNAIPQLNQEVVQDQSASIQAVSGATYTSDGYIESLQQAIDSAGL